MGREAIFDFRTAEGRAGLAESLTALRAGGRRVVFTNGCFDILHVGHLRYLKASKEHGDILVIGLNTDDSVRRNKGPQRPIVPEGERAEMLLGLECVDIVVHFDETTPEKIIEFVRPDALVKGAQYAENEIVGAAFVRSYGGKLVRAEMIEGVSSTDIIQKILSSNGR